GLRRLDAEPGLRGSALESSAERDVCRAERPRGARDTDQHGSRRRQDVKPPRRAAGAVVVRPADAGWRYLVLRCYRNWDFPKGIIEEHEAPLDAALREV